MGHCRELMILIITCMCNAFMDPIKQFQRVTATVLSEFSKLQNKYGDKIPKEILTSFVQQYFAGPGEEFEPWKPKDLPRIPAFLGQVKDGFLYDFGWDLCNIWKDLGRKVHGVFLLSVLSMLACVLVMLLNCPRSEMPIKHDVSVNPDRYSLLYLPNPFIVPGGRFRETYYWDTYWVIRGLLVCQMNDTAKGMLDNFSYMVKTLGHIPNGGRVYYLRRSQPPFYIPMVHEYYRTTGDIDFIKDNIVYMEREYQFWINNRSVDVDKNGTTYTLSQYAVDMAAPRPESYSEDLDTAAGLSEDIQMELYSDLVSAAESGWDFSSRWFSEQPLSGRNVTDGGLRMINTKDVVPVDLNSILCWSEKILADFYSILGNSSKADHYMVQHRKRRNAINSVLWNKEFGMWFDYSLREHKSRTGFFPSNIFPLFVGCGAEDKQQFKDQTTAVETYIKNTGVEYVGGIPTSLTNTGQQWDFPNVWPPLQHAWVVGLSNTDNTTLRNIALSNAQKWIHSNYIGWNRTRAMFEKEGFGWTNGVLLDFLSLYGDRLTHADTVAGNCNSVDTTSGVPQTTALAGCTWTLTLIMGVILTL